MVLFGGHTLDSVSQGSVYILDMKTLDWTQGPSDPAQNRSLMACGASGDNFVVWGGNQLIGPNNVVKLDAVPLVYNIFTSQQVLQFVRRTLYIPTPPTIGSPTSMTPTPTETETDKPSKNNAVLSEDDS
ncbi:hypothetical protein BGX33_000394 [Mortierella sp. NVP41]|nr:hypothetical protein BGX33_000394 [Mortierella sp. NVP41]